MNWRALISQAQLSAKARCKGQNCDIISQLYDGTDHGGPDGSAAKVVRGRPGRSALQGRPLEQNCARQEIQASEAAEKSWHRLEGHNQLPKTLGRMHRSGAAKSGCYRQISATIHPTSTGPHDLGHSALNPRRVASITVPEKTTFNVRLDSARL